MPAKRAGNLQKFRWNQQRITAARMLAEGELPAAKIGEAIGVTAGSIERWKDVPDFAAEIERQSRCLDSSVRQRGIARRFRRIEALNERWSKLNQVIEERATDPSLANVPGGTTGLIIRQLKGLGRGKDYRVVEEFTVDVPLLQELRKIEEQVARECGEWGEVPPALSTGPITTIVVHLGDKNQPRQVIEIPQTEAPPASEAMQGETTPTDLQETPPPG